MTHSPLDQRFLFAVLAMQMSFITKEQLLIAMSRWLEDKSRGIDEHLISDQALTDADRELLLKLVDRYVANHGGDVETSLATIELTTDIREELVALGDADVDATIQLASKGPGTAVAAETVAMHAGASSASESGWAISSHPGRRILAFPRGWKQSASRRFHSR